MQTFLPYQNYSDSARVLDMRRLGKQRVECKQILYAISDPLNLWRSHPAVKMWIGYEQSLIAYATCICREWINRGYVDNLLDDFLEMHMLYPHSLHKPKWLNEKFCSSHRAALLAKNLEWYKQFNWSESPKIEYLWPVK